MRFVDEAVITVRSGKGGRGCASFRREKFIAKGGPNGGDGGKGGDVVLRASGRLVTLHDFRLKRLYEAKNGQPGMGKDRYGKAADDLVLELPVGTLVYEILTPSEAEDADPAVVRALPDAPAHEAEHGGARGAADGAAHGAADDAADKADREVYDGDEPDYDEEPGCGDVGEDLGDPAPASDADADAAPDPDAPRGAVPERLLADLTHDGQEVMVCKGGDGGRGNLHFKTATNQAPRYCEPGWPGQEKRLRLELKILADAGLLGLPNAGKSTLISAVSAARPKIAAYPFTTLTPNLGVMENEIGERLIVADIPGLIEGASQGVGLGHTFLKHVERTRLLIHVLSAEDMGGDDPFAGFELVNEELRRYSADLARKPQVLVVNKIDLLEPERLAELRAAAKAAGIRPHFISALRGDGVPALVADLWRRHKALAIPKA
ncbi:MAG: Obg family GTPase CgtA [Desulfovibrionaceae bacterium]